MLFNSLAFLLVFLPVTLLGYHLAARRAAEWFGPQAGVAWLVGCSLVFYGWWHPPYLLLLVASFAVNYALGCMLRRWSSRLLLAIGIILNLAAIGVFKYLDFFLVDVLGMIGWQQPATGIILPLAISFFTFQQIAFLVDAYRGQAEPGSPWRYALFVTFFPQLIAGPIVHHREMMPQFAADRAHGQHGLRGDDLALGLAVFAVGLGKKVLIADGMAPYATPVFDAAAAGTMPSLFEAWAATLAYTFQLYFDFSGYSDMAIGLAIMFGIRLPFNFAAPYRSTSIIDFWRRWHMTLSRFLRDYLYIPLGGSRRGFSRHLANIMITMLLGGLWHGAGWTFVIWGGLHGVYIVVNHAWRRLMHSGKQEAPHPLLAAVGRSGGWLLTILAVIVGWAIFRAETPQAAILMLQGMAGWGGARLPEYYLDLLGPVGPILQQLGVAFEPLPEFAIAGIEQIAFMAVVALVVLLAPTTQAYFGLVEPEVPARGENPPRPERLALYWRATAWRGVGVGLVLGSIALVLISDVPSEFLYFQF